LSYTRILPRRGALIGRPFRGDVRSGGKGIGSGWEM